MLLVYLVRDPTELLQSHLGMKSIQYSRDWSVLTCENCLDIDSTWGHILGDLASLKDLHGQARVYLLDEVTRGRILSLTDCLFMQCYFFDTQELVLIVKKTYNADVGAMKDQSLTWSL